MIELRDYQERAVAETLRHIESDPVLVMPTGAGKTIAACEMIRRAGVPTLWLAHRRELIAQAAAAIRGQGLTTGVIMAGHPNPRPGVDVAVASVQTIVRRDKPPANLIVIDEAHHVRATTYRSILAHYPSAWVVGLTATPFRADGQGLGDVHGHIVAEVGTADLVRRGYLVDPVVFGPPEPVGLSSIRSHSGDYTKRAAAEVMSAPDLVGNIVRTWERRALGRPTLCFAVNVEHSKLLVRQFRAAGHAAEHVDGSTPPGLRDAIFHRLSIGYTHIVSNVGIASEGTDIPSLEAAIIARPTQSLGLHLQMLGRIMRLSPGKAGAVVLDHAGNHARHGLVTQAISYSLHDAPQQQGAAKAAVKSCPECYLVVAMGARVCPECEFEFGTDAEPRQIRHDEAVELVEIGPELPRDEATLGEQLEAMQRIEERRVALGYKQGWSFYRFKEEFGHAPPAEAMPDAGPKHATMAQKRETLRTLRAEAASNGYKRGWASHRYRALYGVWPRGVG